MTATKKTDNHDPTAKIQLRRHFLDKYHADGSANVLDCCMGSGLLWRMLRKEVQVGSYLGLDLKPKKGRLKIDSARYLAAGGWTHDVIDVDTYGAPWKHWFEILKHAQGSVTVFLTIGLIRMGGGGNMQNEAKATLGLDKINVPGGIIGSLHEISVRYCLTACYDYGIIPTETVEAESTGSARYIGVRLERQKKEG
jgi:hypothetical protein